MCRDAYSVDSLYFARTSSHPAAARVYSRAARRELVVFTRSIEENGFFRPDQVDPARQERVLVSDPRRRAAGTLPRRAQSGIRLAIPPPQYGFLSPDIS